MEAFSKRKLSHKAHFSKTRLSEKKGSFLNEEKGAFSKVMHSHTGSVASFKTFGGESSWHQKKVRPPRKALGPQKAVQCP